MIIIFTIYQAGAMSCYYNTSEDEFLIKAVKWRKDQQKYFQDYKVKCFDPTLNFFSNINNVIGKAIVQQNYTHVKNSDLVTVNLNNILLSPGTMYEIFYASTNNIPVLAFGNAETSNPHILCSITQSFESLNHLNAHIINMYRQMMG